MRDLSLSGSEQPILARTIKDWNMDQRPERRCKSLQSICIIAANDSVSDDVRY